MYHIIFSLILFTLSFSVLSQPKLTPGKAGKYDIGEIKLYLKCYGEGQPSIIVNSGFGGSGSSGGWEDVIREVSVSNQICLYDRANLGKSDWYTKNYDLGIIVSHLHSLLEVAGIAPPYVMVGHSYGSYPIKLFNHRYSNTVAAILLVDPTQYGMFFNGIAKWRPDLEKYSDAFEKRRKDELGGWENPDQNSEKIDLKASAKLLKNSNNFGDKPMALIWSKNGVWSGGDSPDDWHPAVWNRMGNMYKKAIADMHKLSTDQKTLFSVTSEHNIFIHEPETVTRQIKYLLEKLSQE